MNLFASFKFGDRVIINGDPSLVGVVTAACFRTNSYHTIEVSWIHNGSSQSAWIEDWRLSLAEDGAK